MQLWQYTVLQDKERGAALQALVEYWESLPEEHRGALFRLREEDFVAELDAHLKYQLRICRDCRGNVRAPCDAHALSCLLALGAATEFAPHFSIPYGQSYVVTMSGLAYRVMVLPYQYRPVSYYIGS